MYVYDIEEEDTLSDDWAISSTNISITGLQPTFPSLDIICPVSCYFSIVTIFPTTCPASTCSVSMVTITTGTYDCLTSK